MTDQERKAMEMALDALLADQYDMVVGNDGNMEYKTERAIEALRQALAQPEQEPVAWLEYDNEGYLFLSGKRKGAFPVFIAPPSKPWVSLTDEEIDYIYKQNNNQYGEDITGEYERELEAKLKEKNT